MTLDTHRVFWTDGSHTDFRAHKVKAGKEGWVVMSVTRIGDHGPEEIETAWLNPESVKYITEVEEEPADG